MFTIASVEKKRISLQKSKVWKCSVCGYVHKGNEPPEECPQCSSSSKEYSELKDKQKLGYDGEKFDVLLINGSSHRGHNTGVLVGLAEKALIRKGVSHRLFNLNELDIQHCWCCYSMRDSACTYPCRNQLDDVPALQEMIVNSRAVIVASPINWNNMSARLKDFLDRLTCLQNLYLLKKEGLTTGKVVGILVNGHEDGGVKTAMDVFLYFQQMGYVLAPFGFAYRTHGAQYNAKTDDDFFKNDDILRKEVEGIVSNVIETMNQDLEIKLRDKIVPVSE
ncbi:MAG: NAD(P)H-dependent oxidoreductase [Candidatus Methanoperedens sp.]|nr:NAD(P)H-dependent oxidoreductase [Candidatus Methanoperedens sp.]MCE8428256.1 NAD(P)H-dependent oxidoreductase [Candidatus Methanoperedens sp.]